MSSLTYCRVATSYEGPAALNFASASSLQQLGAPPERSRCRIRIIYVIFVLFRDRGQLAEVDSIFICFPSHMLETCFLRVCRVSRCRSYDWCYSLSLHCAGDDNRHARKIFSIFPASRRFQPCSETGNHLQLHRSTQHIDCMQPVTTKASKIELFWKLKIGSDLSRY
jgi:hypothetical protein